MEARIRMPQLRERIMTADEAATFIKDGMTVGISGFTRAGDAKAIPMALADRCKRTGEPMHIQLWTGASVAEEVDRVLAEAGLVNRRLPYQSDKMLRDAINRGDIMYTDQHLSLTVEMIRAGELGRLDVAIIEAVAITEDGEIVPSTSVGNSPTFAAVADKVIIELNTRQSALLEGMHDIYLPGARPHREPLPLQEVDQRIGTTSIPVALDKIVGIVLTDRSDHFVNMVPGDEETELIAQHLIDFFDHQVRTGQMPPELYPLQSGVGAVSNAVLSGFASAGFKDLTMYSEVLQDAVFELLDRGVLRFASGCAITVTPDHATEVMQRLHDYKDKIILRPQEISNHPEIIRRLGVIAMNTALEADIYGNVNSTHVSGTHIMNGIGGSGDFARNALLSVFVTKSTAKNGKISSIVPMVSHVDHTEHDVDILVTEQGLADLRGLAPRERSRLVIEKCVHPDYKSAMLDYVERAELRGGQTPHVIEEALSWHQRYRETGSMQVKELEYSTR